MGDPDISVLKKFIKPESPTGLFTLQEQLAVGSFGAVYKAHLKGVSNVIALKVIEVLVDEGETWEDLVVELEVLSVCDHPNIVKYYGSWQKDRELMIALELCSASLFQVQHVGLTFSASQIAEILRESLIGLQYLHSINIIHRDIKAGNILLTEAGGIKLVDFGVSAVCSSKNQKRYSFTGTPYWMAPEIIENRTQQSPYDNKVDVWALGVTAIELADGGTPWDKIHPIRALFKITSGDPPTVKDPSKWPAELSEYIARSVVKEAEGRATVDELLAMPWIQNAPSGQLAEFVPKFAKLNNAKKKTKGEHKSSSSSSSEEETGKTQESGGTKYMTAPWTAEPGQATYVDRQDVNQAILDKLLKHQLKEVEELTKQQRIVIEKENGNLERALTQIAVEFEKKRQSVEARWSKEEDAVEKRKQKALADSEKNLQSQISAAGKDMKFLTKQSTKTIENLGKVEKKRLADSAKAGIQFDAGNLTKPQAKLYRELLQLKATQRFDVEAVTLDQLVTKTSQLFEETNNQIKEQDKSVELQHMAHREKVDILARSLQELNQARLQQMEEGNLLDIEELKTRQALQSKHLVALLDLEQRQLGVVQKLEQGHLQKQQAMQTKLARLANRKTVNQAYINAGKDRRTEPRWGDELSRKLEREFDGKLQEETRTFLEYQAEQRTHKGKEQDEKKRRRLEFEKEELRTQQEIHEKRKEKLKAKSDETKKEILDTLKRDMDALNQTGLERGLEINTAAMSRANECLRAYSETVAILMKSHYEKVKEVLSRIILTDREVLLKQGMAPEDIDKKQRKQQADEHTEWKQKLKYFEETELVKHQAELNEKFNRTSQRLKDTHTERKTLGKQTVSRYMGQKMKDQGKPPRRGSRPPTLTVMDAPQREPRTSLDSSTPKKSRPPTHKRQSSAHSGSSGSGHHHQRKPSQH